MLCNLFFQEITVARPNESKAPTLSVPMTTSNHAQIEHALVPESSEKIKKAKNIRKNFLRNLNQSTNRLRLELREELLGQFSNFMQLVANDISDYVLENINEQLGDFYAGLINLSNEVVSNDCSMMIAIHDFVKEVSAYHDESQILALEERCEQILPGQIKDDKVIK